MNFLKYIWNYWKPYTALVATPYRDISITFLRGSVKSVTITPPVVRGASYEYVVMDEAVNYH